MFCDYTAGLIAGVISLIIGHPLDTIKIQQQVRPLRFIEAVNRIKSHRGWKGFYRGVTAPLFANGVINSVFFGVYADVYEYLVESGLRKVGSHEEESSSQKRQSGGTETSLEDKNQIRKVAYKELFISGTAAGLATIPIIAPIELVKTKLQSQMKRTIFKGSIDCLVNIMREAGIRGVYRGVLPLMIRDVPGGGAYFVVYEGIRQIMRKYNNSNSKATESIIAGGLAGMSNWVLVLPFDTIKTRLQADDHINPKYRSSMHVAQEIFSKDGIRGFYRGLVSVSVRAFPVNAVMFLVYELMQHRMCAR